MLLDLVSLLCFVSKEAFILFKSLAKFSKSLALSLLALSVLVSSPASAQVVEADSIIFGLGTLTRDRVQDLDFLDLGETVGRSFEDISAQLGDGGEFAGFRYATFEEITNLASNFRVTPETPTLTGLIDLTFSIGPTIQGSTGLTAEILDSGDIQLVGVNDASSEFLPENQRANVNLGAVFTPVQTSGTVGSFLVTPTPVPEPSSVTLCAVLCGMGILVRRKKQFV